MKQIGSAVQHIYTGTPGVIVGYSYEDGTCWLVVEWLAEGIAPNVPSWSVAVLPSEMHLLAVV